MKDDLLSYAEYLANDICDRLRLMVDRQPLENVEKVDYRDLDSQVEQLHKVSTALLMRSDAESYAKRDAIEITKGKP